MENEGVSAVSFKSRDELLRILCMRAFGYLPTFEEDTKLKQQGAVAICKAGYVEELEDKLRRVREIVTATREYYESVPCRDERTMLGVLDNIELALK